MDAETEQGEENEENQDDEELVVTASKWCDCGVCCREFMHSEDILEPPGVMQVQDFMVTELQILNSQRLDLIESLR